MATTARVGTTTRSAAINERAKIASFLKEVSNYRWDEFVRAEKDENYTGYQAVVFALVRATTDNKLAAISLALDRIDGKVETPIQIVYPKVYMLFPNAKNEPTPPASLPEGHSDIKEISVSDDAPQEDTAEHLATLGLRETLNKMADQPRKLVEMILERKLQVELAIRKDDKIELSNVPLVKSVIAANLLRMAYDGNLDAVSSVFDQIDGKLVETLRVLGDDIYLTSYLEEAPAGAVKNADGIYMIENEGITNIWESKLKSKLE